MRQRMMRCVLGEYRRAHGADERYHDILTLLPVGVESPHQLAAISSR